ncbi:MAG: UDP-N-acetylmuramate--L-alanine ligase [Clostridia bacterium]|nr:UDP-N-acetylmuramate--L-alanine ligase [Clostridia bacterium]
MSEAIRAAGKRLHFIGIGGSSMSGLARFMLHEGCVVTGSDRDRSHKTEALEALGIAVSIGHRAENVRGADLVIYSAAIPENNPERAEAARLGIPQIERAVLLGRLMTTFENAVCVSGTHGKTTTTSMLAQVFVEAGEDPGVHIGGELDAIGGGTRVGRGSTFIAEACEYSGSFWHFFPTVAVILNIDEDHLDFYKDLDDIEASFRRFAGLVPETGWVVGWGGDSRVRRVLSGLRCHTRTYGLEPHNELRAEEISYDELGRPHFTATLFGHPLAEVELAVAGEKNLLDALACIAVADICQLPMGSVSATLGRFTGAHRRFELTSVTDGVRLYTDYAHNPAEMQTAIHIASMQPHNALWAVWQPHTYSRTKTLFDGFMNTFSEADFVLVTDIMGAREADPGDINTPMLIDGLTKRGVKAVYTPTFNDAERYLREHWHPDDLVITLGCGNIDLLNEQIALHGDTEKPAPSPAEED